MSIRSIQIENLLSFRKIIINDIADINCIVGKNNTGKSNLLKLINYFYFLLDGGRELPPQLHSKYSKYGSISIEYDVERIRNIVTSKKNSNTPFFKHIFNTIFKSSSYFRNTATFKLTLTINENNSVEWSTKNKDVLYIICYLYPFFEIQTRHIDLYDWDKLWHLVCRLKSFNVNKINSDDIIGFFNKNLSSGANEYRDYVKKIQGITQTTEYSYRDKVLNFVKVGLDGHNFLIEGASLKSQSDGTNSYRYIEIFITLLIALTRRDFITPTVYIDEPEIGLHPKLIEQLIKKIFDTYNSFKKTKISFEKGKYATPYPKIFFSTHSPNIIKSVIKLFPTVHKVYHFSKFEGSTKVKKMNSQYNDLRFLNIFSDNEARLFFSDFIFFVEGETELELFGNLKLVSKFKQLEKVDIYKMNTVSFYGINPGFSNAAIPYLVLYDLDKLLLINLAENHLQFYTANINFSDFFLKCSRSYYGSDQFHLKRSLKKYLSTKDGGSIILDANKISVDGLSKFDGISLKEYVELINASILNYFNYIVATTTIEGTLINERSRRYFLRWITHEINNCLNVGFLKNPSKTLLSLSENTDFLCPSDVLKAMKTLLCLSPARCPLTASETKFIKNLKLAYIRILFQKLSTLFSGNIEMMAAFRLLFNGKTESLVALKNKSLLSHQYCNAVEELKKLFFPLAGLTDKTSGWVTRFVDFSIDSIDEKPGQEGFREIFSRDFPELFDILEKLQPR